MIKEIITIVGSSAGAIAVLALLAKSLVKHMLDKDVAVFKSRLETAATQEVERLKAQLQLELSKQQFTFTKLHERRAEVVADIFALLVQTHGLVTILASATAERQNVNRAKEGRDLLKQARPKQLETSEKFNENRILLDEHLCELLARCMREYDGLIRMCEERLDKPQPTLEADKLAGNKPILDMQISLNNLAETLRKDLCSEFRKILGAADNK